jgi:hypothetical protein
VWCNSCTEVVRCTESTKCAEQRNSGSDSNVHILIFRTEHGVSLTLQVIKSKGYGGKLNSKRWLQQVRFLRAHNFICLGRVVT